MFLKSRTLGLACLLLVLAWGGTAQAQYLLTGNSGGELQIGTGLPLPVGTAGIFLGGMTPMNGGTSCGAGPGGCQQSPDGPGTAYWPPLLIPPAANVSTGGTPTRTIMQNNATTMGGTISVPTAVLSRNAGGTPVPIAVFPTNPAVFQVATSINYAWPAAAATLAPGGAPGPTVVGTPVAGGVMAYSGGAKAFGGPARFAIQAGPGASNAPNVNTTVVGTMGTTVMRWVGGKRVPAKTVMQTTPTTTTFMKPPVASVWINFAGGFPSTVGAVAVVGASNPIGLAQPGAPIASPSGTTMFGPLAPADGPFGALNSPGGFPCCNATMGGSVMSSLLLPQVTLPMGTVLGGLSNMVTNSKGFPWTTGFLTLSQPAASPPEVFFQSGTDMRVAGQGNVSLVSGALSVRALSGPNANRGWLSLTLPEPTTALAAAGALGMLGLCHGLVRRRSR